MEGFFIQVIEGSPFDKVLERFPEGFPALMLADQVAGKLYPARFKRAKSGDIFWLVDRQQLRLDQWIALDILHGQCIECVWVNWELYAELTGELSSEERSNDEEALYPLLVEVLDIPIVLFGTSFGISERWVEKSDPRIQRMIQAQEVLRFTEGQIKPMQ
ncbi:hypothetical protein ACQ4M3_06280 [Leptolyngbya sp. AN03gr2]|uniref:hypothetical protein n=1 Tax=unclassified Leptolyngbya TaxID=2650499 RepID=UPI003D322514